MSDVPQEEGPAADSDAGEAATPTSEPAAADPTQAHVAGELAHDAPLINCRFDPTGTWLFATDEGAKVIRWHLESGEKTVLSGHETWARGIAFSVGGETVVTSGYDESLIWWPVADEQPEPLRTVKAHTGWIRTLAVSPDGQVLASGGNDRMVRLWNLQDGSPRGELAGHDSQVYSTFFHPDGQFLLSGDLKGVVHQWEWSTGELVRSFDASALHTYNSGQRVDYGGVRSIDLSPDGMHLACSGLHKATNPLGAVNEPLVLRFSWESQELEQSHVAEGVRGIGWRTLYHPQAFMTGVAGGSGGGFVLFWNHEADKTFHQLKLPNTAREFDLHPDGLRLATAHHDSRARIVKLGPQEASGC